MLIPTFNIELGNCNAFFDPTVDSWKVINNQIVFNLDSISTTIDITSEKIIAYNVGVTEVHPVNSDFLNSLRSQQSILFILLQYDFYGTPILLENKYLNFPTLQIMPDNKARGIYPNIVSFTEIVEVLHPNISLVNSSGTSQSLLGQNFISAGSYTFKLSVSDFINTLNIKYLNNIGTQFTLNQNTSLYIDDGTTLKLWGPTSSYQFISGKRYKGILSTKSNHNIKIGKYNNNINCYSFDIYCI